MNISHNKAPQGETEHKENMEGGSAVLHPTHQVIAYIPLIKRKTSAGKDETNNKEDCDELEQQAANKMAENS